jgi:hypothetical protein
VTADHGEQKEAPMSLIGTVIVTVCFLASLLPYLMPGTGISLIGKVLNDTLGDPVWQLLPFARGTLAVSVGGNPVLTLEGVLAVYMPLLALLFWSQRGR